MGDVENQKENLGEIDTQNLFEKPKQAISYPKSSASMIASTTVHVADPPIKHVHIDEEAGEKANKNNAPRDPRLATTYLSYRLYIKGIFLILAIFSII